MRRLAEQILTHVRPLPEGAVIGPKTLLHLGRRAAVDQALSRLARRGGLTRIGRGLYVLPVAGRFGKRSPSPLKVVESLAVATGETVAPHGAAAANALGLTTQVPVQMVFLTSGRTRRF
ncbi:MAG: type IV toxin-antitoxin system AbiEi family antitoxin domain-containing protein, partial [Proteobacteria bacterium]|nr:type IV toxin-antitoxin system AbiEi family antitoxin domain-containing protein [Pseudomonadota bacterium]